MTGNELDEILSDDDDIVIEETPEETSVEPEQGAEANAEAEATPAEEPQAEVPGDEENAEPEEPSTVPLAALHAEREKRQEAATENQQLRDELMQMRGQLNALSQQKQPPKPTEPEVKPDFWEAPDDFINHSMNPVRQEIADQREQFSRMMAEDKHGAETVQAAFQALGHAMQTDPSAQHEYNRIKSSPHPYGAMVEWHKSQQNRQMVGDDPQAWLEAELEKKLADPAFQADYLQRIRGDAQNNGQNQTSSTPNVNLPPSISNISGSGNTAVDNDMSDEALFNGALA